MDCRTKQLLQFRFPSYAQQLKEMRDRVRSAMEERGVDSGIVSHVVIAVNEACMNIIQHAYGEEAGDIVLELLCEGSELVVRITDFARPVDISRIRSRALEDIRPGGLGVYMMEELMDEVRYMENPQGAGNVLQMKKKLGQPCSCHKG